jgi:hypothetical protein
VDTAAGVGAEVAVVMAGVGADAAAGVEVVAVVGVVATAAATAVEIAKISSGSNAQMGEITFFARAC